MFNRNNLDKSTSPYLLQHKDNPIHWQEYSKEIIDYAVHEDKPILISIGYSTCHWCHVMAADTFSNDEIAQYMNDNYVCIKVDREQRPDIDTFCMSFMQEAYGQGGWPLNVVLTPTLKPFFAATYIASSPKYNMPGFLEIAERVLNYYTENKNDIDDYHPQNFETQIVESPNFKIYEQQFDKENWGFLSEQKFPPHCSLMYLLSTPYARKSEEVQTFLKNTLDKMQNSGLHDHVGGGFFRYCVDPKWEVPHFEKMLYDQAMMLINYSLGYFLFNDSTYKNTIERILFSLKDTFETNHLYMSGHDADTNHEEGKTYLWNENDFKNIKNSSFSDFESTNFEGKFHITSAPNTDSLDELYKIRKSRDQPEVDTKIVTSWNALLGVAFCFVEKFANIKTKADKHYWELIKQKNFHTTNNNEKQHNYFLEDAASILLLQTYLFEKGIVSITELTKQYNELLQFNIDNRWVENPNSDFNIVTAQQFDHPLPSTQSILNWAILRYKIIIDDETPDLDYSLPISFDAQNYASLFEREHRLYKLLNPPDKSEILSIFVKDDSNTVCYKGACTPYDPKST